jgi:hypothetical protein
MLTRNIKSIKDRIATESPGSKARIKSLQPIIVKGSHLTVSTWPNGRVELSWDWEELIRDVREAVAVIETTPVKKKRAPKQKKIKDDIQQS